MLRFSFGLLCHSTRDELLPLLKPNSHDVLHLVNDFLVNVLLRLLRVYLIERALLTLVRTRLQLKELGRD